jgi:hypothetical protein
MMKKQNGFQFVMVVLWMAILLSACLAGSETAVIEPTAIANTDNDTADLQPTPTLTTAVEQVAPTTTAVPPTPVPTEAAAATAVPLTPTPIPPTLTPEIVPVDIEQARQELQRLAFPSVTYESVYAFPLASQPNWWLAHSEGLRPFPGDHAAAIYGYEAGQWQEIARLALEAPDFMFEGSISEVDLADGRLWFEVSSGVGAHGNCYDLLRYDFNTFEDILDHCHSSNASGGVGDVNADGRPDLVLNQTDDYVFCYACGVRYPGYDIYEFVDGDWQPVYLEPLPEDVLPVLRDLNNEAISLFQIGLYKDAAAVINEIVGDIPIVLWNQTIINLYASDARAQAQSGPLPLLGHLFYGDYPPVIDMMRSYTPAELFTAQNNPLVVGTVAEGWEDTLAQWVTSTTVDVVMERPDNAAAHFIYAWGLYLADPTDARVIEELETAVSLDQEFLYNASLTYLRGQ